MMGTTLMAAAEKDEGASGSGTTREDSGAALDPQGSAGPDIPADDGLPVEEAERQALAVALRDEAALN